MIVSLLRQLRVRHRLQTLLGTRPGTRTTHDDGLVAEHPPIDAYVICASPRTGSTLLCGLLESTGIAGRPQSYFKRESMAASARAWEVTRPADRSIDTAFIEAAVVAGSTPNGVFGLRVMWETMAELTEALARLRADPANSDLQLLTDTFGRTRFVHLRRADVIAQAVSWARAEQTHFWHPHEEVIPGGQTPRFDRDLIAQLAGKINQAEAGWQDWFGRLGVTPHEIEYEDLAADPIRVTHAMLDYLDLELRADRPIRVRHRRQADDLNEDWITRFRAG